MRGEQFRCNIHSTFDMALTIISDNSEACLIILRVGHRRIPSMKMVAATDETFAFENEGWNLPVRHRNRIPFNAPVRRGLGARCPTDGRCHMGRSPPTLPCSAVGICGSTAWGMPLTSALGHRAVSIVMARTQKLKVYRTPAGFDDAYVAAVSQKAALEAWGSERDLFARGIAELVTDPALTAEPLASPGVVVKHSRGTTAEQIKAMPDLEPRTTRRGGAGQTEASKQPRKPKPSPKPKPSSSKLEAAETALETVTADYDGRMKALADREAKLARERRDLEKQQHDTVDAAQASVREARQDYDDAMRQWRQSKSDA